MLRITATALFAALVRSETEDSFPSIIRERRADFDKLDQSLRSSTVIDPYGAVILVPQATEESVVSPQWLLYEAQRFVQHAHGLAQRPELTYAGGHSGPACGALHYSDNRATKTVISYNATVGDGGTVEERTYQPMFGHLCTLTVRGTHPLPWVEGELGAPKARPHKDTQQAPKQVADAPLNVTHRLLMSVGIPHGDVSVYSYTYGCGESGVGVCTGEGTSVGTKVEGQTEGKAAQSKEAAVSADGSITPTPASPATIPIRLLSFNVWNVNPPTWLWRDAKDRMRGYTFRMLGLADALAQSDADIIAFQEVRYDSGLGGWDDVKQRPSQASNPVFTPPAAAPAEGEGQQEKDAVQDPQAVLAAMDAQEDDHHSILVKPARGQTNDFSFAHNVAQYWYNWTIDFMSNPRYGDKGRGKWSDIVQAEGWLQYGSKHPTEGSACAVDFQAVLPELSGCSPYRDLGLPKRASPIRSRVQRALRRHPHAQIMHLAALLPPGWHFAYQPASLYLDRTSWAGGQEQRDEEGPAIFSRWPIRATHALLLSRNTSDEGDGHQRLCLHAAIEVPASRLAALVAQAAAGKRGAPPSTPVPSAKEGPNVVLDIYTVHLALAEAARNRSVGEILSFISSTATGSAVVLTGDMNAEPHEPAMKAFLQRVAGGVKEQGQEQEGREVVVLTLPDGRPMTLLQGKTAPASSSSSWQPSFRDSWLEAGYPEPPPRSGDSAIKRYGLTFPSDAPTKRIDMVLAADGPASGSTVSVSSSWLLGQDALPGTDAYEGRGTGMVHEHAPIYPSDHRAVAVDLHIKV